MQNITSLIAQGKIDIALAELQKRASGTPTYDEVMLQTGRFNKLERNNRLGILSLDDFNRGINKVATAIINLERKVSVKAVSGIPQTSSGVSDIVDQLKLIKKKTRFGFSMDFKSNLGQLLDRFLIYEMEKRGNDLYDADETKIELLQQQYETFVEEYEREYRTKDKVKRAVIKEKLNELEIALTLENVKCLTSMLVAYNTKYAYLSEAIEHISESGLENYAYQLAEIIDAL